MGKHKASDNQLKDMFQEGRFVARALQINALVKGHADTIEADNEIRFLNSTSQGGTHMNVERHGQRGRSATLVVPDVDMSLFARVGFVYDADKSSIKAYMFHDSQTMSQTDPSGYYNINIDKHKFEPIIARQQFVEKYQEYMRKADNLELRDNEREYDRPEQFGRYNEVLGNFFPESLTALVGRDTTLPTLRDLLLLRQLMDDKYGMDLPMTLMGQGKIKVWHPTLNDITFILNQSKQEIITAAAKSGQEPLLVLQELANNLGYPVAINDLDTPITPQHLSISNKNAFKAQEIVDYVSALTGIPKGGSFTYGIMGRLSEIVNQRLLSEGGGQVTALHNTIIQKEDIKSLVSLLDKELAVKDKHHMVMEDKTVEDLSDTIASAIYFKRINPNESVQENTLFNAEVKKSTFSAKVSEFFAKISSLFIDNTITKKVESNSFKDKLNDVKNAATTNQAKDNAEDNIKEVSDAKYSP